MKQPSLPRTPQEVKYHKFLEVLVDEVERTHPGVFDIRIGKPSPGVVDGIVITKAGIEGYVFIVGSARTLESIQGGVWLDGAEHIYGASILAKREWEQSDLTHWNVRCLESRSSKEACEIIEWIVSDWAFDRPWLAPLPVDEQYEKKRLAKIAIGLKSRTEIPVVIEVQSVTEANLTTEAEARLIGDLAGLRVESIRNEFPADKRGNLATGTTVLLGCYQTKSPPARDRRLCLTAVGPRVRTDPQTIRVRLEALIPVNQDHNWQHERWRWQIDSADSNRSSRWGSPVPVEELAGKILSSTELQQKLNDGRANESDRAALAILLQDEGKLLEAVQLFGVQIDDDVRRLCGGQKIYPPACCAYADEKWVARLREWLRACAPWLLGQATRRESERILAWAAEKRGRKTQRPKLKLLIFPGQHHSRKACLILTSLDFEGKQPCLRIQATASNTRLHESAWRRPIEIDFARYQLL